MARATAYAKEQRLARGEVQPPQAVEQPRPARKHEPSLLAVQILRDRSVLKAEPQEQSHARHVARESERATRARHNNRGKAPEDGGAREKVAREVAREGPQKPRPQPQPAPDSPTRDDLRERQRALRAELRRVRQELGDEKQRERERHERREKQREKQRERQSEMHERPEAREKEAGETERREHRQRVGVEEKASALPRLSLPSPRTIAAADARLSEIKAKLALTPSMIGFRGNGEVRGEKGMGLLQDLGLSERDRRDAAAIMEMKVLWAQAAATRVIAHRMG